MLDLISWLVAIDKSVFLFINKALANPATDFIMPLITADLHLKLFYAVCLGLILVKGNNQLRWAVIFSLLTVTITDQLSSAVLKPLLARPRPCRIMEVHLLVGCGAGFSMPSSHAANLFGQAYFFKIIASRSAYYLIPLAVIVAISRIFVGVHYPGDIMIGAALGTVAGFGMGHLFLLFFKKTKFRITLPKEGKMPVRIEALEGDITKAKTEAIVNAANNHLWMGSGVAGAIKRRGGVEIEEDAVSKGPIKVGEAVESIAGKLPYKYIIHAAGMGQDLKTDEHIVYEVTKNSLLLADRLKLKSLALPSIGTGVGGLPVELCAKRMIMAVRELSNELKHLERVVFVLFGQAALESFESEIKRD